MWLDGIEQKYVEEVGSMNILFVIDNELITPELNGCILSGITRNSVLQLARQWGMKTAERKITIDEVFNAHQDGRLNEIFGSGTAAVISPVGEIKYENRTAVINEGQAGPIAQRLFNTMMDIQYGKTEDLMEWIEPVC